MEIGDELSIKEQQELRKLLRKHKSIFSKSETDIGFCTEVKHHIRTTDDIPVRVPQS